MDYYKILNLDEGASLKQIEQAYADLSSFYNPDSNASKLAYKKYREVNKAYLILKENKQRELYNLVRKNDEYNNKNEELDNNKIDISSYDKSKYTNRVKDIKEYNDVIVNDIYNDYLIINLEIPYLYYLVNSEYKVDFYKEVIKHKEGICLTCLGIGKVKENDKVVYCRECLGSGEKVEKEKKLISIKVKVDDKVILDEHKVIINFNFYDKDSYIVNSNEINYSLNVDEEKFHKGVSFELINNDNRLIIKKDNFDCLNEQYIFMNKIINISYQLTSYKGKDRNGYIVCDREYIYLDPKDYTYSYKANSKCTLKIELKDKVVCIKGLGYKGYNRENGDLILNVIKISNNEYLKVFFDKKLRKVSANLFKLKGKYNNHYFKTNKQFDYDNKYLYIPSLAHTLKIKNYLVFQIIFYVLYLIIPLILFFIFGISYTFFIVSFISLFVYLIGVNLIMEVKL